MARIGVRRETLAKMLTSHGEDDLAERALSLTDDELARIGTLGAYYAWSEEALAYGGSMGGARSLSLATVDVLESSQRDLRWHHTNAELEFGWGDEPDAVERARDRSLRLHAAEQQQPPRG